MYSDCDVCECSERGEKCLCNVRLYFTWLKPSLQTQKRSIAIIICGIYTEHSEYMGSGECLLLTIHTRAERGAVIDNCARGQARGPWGAVLNCSVTHVTRRRGPRRCTPSLFTTRSHPPGQSTHKVAPIKMKVDYLFQAPQHTTLPWLPHTGYPDRDGPIKACVTLFRVPFVKSSLGLTCKKKRGVFADNNFTLTILSINYICYLLSVRCNKSTYSDRSM